LQTLEAKGWQFLQRQVAFLMADSATSIRRLAKLIKNLRWYGIGLFAVHADFHLPRSDRLETGELETCFELAFRLGFLSESDKSQVLTLSDSVGRLLHGLHRSLKQRIARRRSDP